MVYPTWKVKQLSTHELLWCGDFKSGVCGPEYISFVVAGWIFVKSFIIFDLLIKNYIHSVFYYFLRLLVNFAGVACSWVWHAWTSYPLQRLSHMLLMEFVIMLHGMDTYRWSYILYFIHIS